MYLSRYGTWLENGIYPTRLSIAFLCNYSSSKIDKRAFYIGLILIPWLGLLIRKGAGYFIFLFALLLN